MAQIPALRSKNPLTLHALSLALASALVHAGWNVMLARERDSQAATAAALAVGVLVLAPFALVFWDVSERALPWAAASAVLELAYLVLLARAYDRSDVSVVYPVARGAAPVLVLVATVAVVGEPATAAGAAGVLLVAAGVVLLRGAGAADAAGVAAGLAIGATIAGYTLTDAQGLRHAAAVPYLLLTLGPSAIVYPWLLARRGRDVRAALRRPAIGVAGLGIVGGYLLVLAALEVAPARDVPAVAAARETSVVIAMALSALLLGERVTLRRAGAALLVVAGVALLAR